MESDLKSLAGAWRVRIQQQRTARRERAARARVAAHEAAVVLKEEFGVEDVWLFGSLVAEPRHDDFDVDLAVRGLAPERYFSALARVCDVVGGHVDLVTLESCSERLRSTVAATGERLDG